MFAVERTTNINGNPIEIGINGVESISYFSTIGSLSRRAVVFPFLSTQLKGKRKIYLCDLGASAVKYTGPIKNMSGNPY